MNIVKNMLLSGNHGAPIATDIFYDEAAGPKPLIVYMHGFNGFKDWGGFDLIARQFTEGGFTFIKFNGSHNGTTPDHPEVFTNLEAYAQNNYTTELDDLAVVLNWALAADNPYAAWIDQARTGLCGHSRGGGIVLLKAAEDARINAVATWASVSECKSPWGGWPAARLSAWKAAGVDYVENARTKQQMPLGYQLYEDYQTNRARLDIESAISSLHIPVLLVHGTADTSVLIDNAYLLKQWQPAAELYTIESDHVFGRRHPWSEDHLRLPMQMVVDNTIRFFQEALSHADDK